MFALVIGGAGSGKSAWAEDLVRGLGIRPCYYLATMQPMDAECGARIARHRAQRAGKGFVTVERPVDLAGLRLPRRGAVLLEDLGNLAANEWYSPGGAGPEGALDAILDGIDSLRAQCRALVVVSNEIFAGGRDYAPGTEAYLELLARAHLALAARADQVCEVAFGLPVFYKKGGRNDEMEPQTRP